MSLTTYDPHFSNFRRWERVIREGMDAVLKGGTYAVNGGSLSPVTIVQRIKEAMSAHSVNHYESSFLPIDWFLENRKLVTVAFERGTILFRRQKQRGTRLETVGPSFLMDLTDPEEVVLASLIVLYSHNLLPTPSRLCLKDPSVLDKYKALNVSVIENNGYYIIS